MRRNEGVGRRHSGKERGKKDGERKQRGDNEVKGDGESGTEEKEEKRWRRRTRGQKENQGIVETTVALISSN